MKFSKRRVAWALFWLFAVFVLLPAAYIWNEGVHDKLGKADVAVVLGNKVELDGRPSDRLAARLDRALDVYRQGYVTRILVSGGIGKEGFDEAKVMAAYLVAKGVPKADIFEDPVGYDTFLTARNTTRFWHKPDEYRPPVARASPVTRASCPCLTMDSSFQLDAGQTPVPSGLCHRI